MEKKPRPRKKDLPAMSDDELREFVMGYCDGKIFTANDIPSVRIPKPTQEEIERSARDMGLVFVPLALGAMEKIAHPSQVGTFWEWTKDAMPRSINGMPMFFSLRVMYKPDWIRACRAIKREMNRRKRVKV